MCTLDLSQMIFMLVGINVNVLASVFVCVHLCHIASTGKGRAVQDIHSECSEGAA